jgi:hypothetical protein
MTDAALPTTEPSTNGAGTRQQRLAAAVKNLRTRQSLSTMSADRWVLIAGAIMVPLGIALIILGWYGAAHKALIIQQFPYLISGGILGLGLMITGGLAYFGFWITRLVHENRTNTRDVIAAIDRLAVLAGDENGDGTGTGTGRASAPAPGTFVATATGTMLHRPDCPVVANRPGVRKVKAGTAGFEACKICEPELVDLTSG